MPGASRQPLPEISGRDGKRIVSSGRWAWRTLLEVHGMLMSRFEASMTDKAGIDLQTYDVLLHTYEGGKAGIRMNALAQDVLISKSGLTSIVDKLEDKGWLKRIPDPDDRRATRLTLTRSGKAILDRAMKIHIKDVRELFSAHLTEKEDSLVTEILGRVRDAAES